MGVKVTLDKKRVAARVDKATDAMMAPLSEQILADSNEFVRVDQGQLKESSGTYSIPRQGHLEWNTPYAKRVYYTGTPSKDQNPNASLRWVEKAKAKFQADWDKLAQRLFGKGMK